MSGHTRLALLRRLVRALLPAWRFFDEIDPAPRLFVRVGLPGEALGSWQAVSLLAPARGPISLLFAPASNLALAEHALLEQLLDDAAEPHASANTVEQLVSYRLVARLSRAQAQRVHAAERYQFKLVLGQEAVEEELLVSGVFAL